MGRLWISPRRSTVFSAERARAIPRATDPQSIRPPVTATAVSTAARTIAAVDSAVVEADLEAVVVDVEGEAAGLEEAVVDSVEAASGVTPLTAEPTARSAIAETLRV